MSFNGPLDGYRVLEFGHMVMGPTCGLILADLGAEVIKIEPQGTGDKTRQLGSFGTGFFCTYNRNKKSFAVDLKSDQGKQLVLELTQSADVVTENFREGTMEKLGLGYEELKKVNPGLVYCSMRGFLKGPYEHRAALDEVVQMMGGLAFMTGPEGRPSRVGASVNDIMGGMFGVIGILAALLRRGDSDDGALVKSGLFETCALLMAQHVATYLRTETPSKSLFERESQPWPVYDLFATREGNRIFVGLVTDGQWVSFCKKFGLNDWLEDPTLQNTQDRVIARDRILKRLNEIFAAMDLATAEAQLDKVGCPFAPVARPEDLLGDRHLNESGGLLQVEIEPGKLGKIPNLPLQIDNQRPDLRIQPPRVGEHTRELVSALGHDVSEIDEYIESGVLSEDARLHVTG